MTEINLNKTRVQFYSSIKELPIDLSKKMQGYLLQHIGIGSTVSDIDDHLERLTTLIKSETDRKTEITQELKNMRYAMFSAVSEISYDAPAFACLVHSINGKKIEDYSLDGLNKITSYLSKKGLTVELVSDILQEVKKNWIPNANFTFQTSFQKT